MLLGKRSHAILQELILQNKNVSINELTQRFSVSRRTIYNEIDRINYWLKKRKLHPVLYQRSQGFYLKSDTKEILSNEFPLSDLHYVEYTAEERVAWSALQLLISESLLLIQDLSECTNVSRNTAIEDLKKVKAELEQFHIMVDFQKKEGYILHGKEVDKRKAILFYLFSLLSMQESHQPIFEKIGELVHLSELNLDPIFTVLQECEWNLEVRFTDNDYYQLVLHLFLISRRIVRGQLVSIDTVEKTVIRETLEYLAAEKAAQTMTDIFSVSFPEDEVYYITTLLLSAKLHHKYRDDTDAFHSLEMAIRYMVSDFQTLAGVVFQNTHEIEENLLIHLQPAFFRCKYGLNMHNPLTDLIKEKYEDIFLLTKKVIHHFEKLTKSPLGDDEIAFIAIHFGGWLRKEGMEPLIRKKGLIVCNSGIGTSAILRKQLESLFPSINFIRTMSAREYESEGAQADVDVVISTVPIVKKNHPLFVVNPILSEPEKISLLNKLYSIIGKQVDITKSATIECILDIIKEFADIHDEKGLENGLRSLLSKGNEQKNIDFRPELLHVLTKSNIQIQEGSNNWRSAIKLAAGPLLQQKIISKAYVDAMIAHVEEKGPYIIIAPEIALPHAKPEEGALGIGMSMLILKNPIAFSEDVKHKIKILIVLSSIDQVRHLRAMSELTNLLSKDSNLSKLKDCESVDEVWSILQQQ
ncbi:BglG family transcription antiterminator [Lederbergia citri]|uniref:BglG family transcription antiterminator n=1 Tax=Lederbergia citri TaxID=2833580 RepID=A0A942TF64_9BACI|nr:BglG family transcription antiterminator [Lederbergia citri]MBS4195631.1 BglG family transcription antiterminator [Lederbergia citri]